MQLDAQVYDAFETGMHQSVEAAKSSQTAVAAALQDSLVQAKALAGTMSTELQEGQRHLMSLATEAASSMLPPPPSPPLPPLLFEPLTWTGLFNADVSLQDIRLSILFRCIPAHAASFCIKAF